ncbi:hypothetical protein WR25_14278 [Diploscapter pachys]|uniref:Uncharacterized protein n=1 Tax=Diploscapter pachys TaxID=2018661 RepID=A0A2A2LVN4_9BILA|nr:hypothetical protein WR25_14278 [Diploscapter pachys]
MNGIGRVYETGPCRSVPVVAPSMPGLDMMMDERKIGGGHKPQTDFKPIPKNFKPQGEFMIAIFTYAWAQQQYCNQPQFTYCTSRLGEYWNTDMNDFWKYPDRMDQVIQNLIGTDYSIGNLVNVCNGWANFYACLGAGNIGTCLGVFGHVARGDSPATAYQYSGFLQDWAFKCGAGFFAIYESANYTDCTLRTFMNYQREMGAYFDAYNKNTAADRDNSCTYAQALMNGIGSIYQTGPCRTLPGHNSRAFWYGCQAAREYSNAQFWHCRHITKCPWTDQSTFEITDKMSRFNEQSQKFEYFVDGHYELLGDKKVYHEPRWIESTQLE